MKIYTKTGDKGKTRVFGGMIADKDDIRVECNGILDETACDIGVLRTQLSTDHEWQTKLYQIQIDLMDMMSHVATHSSMRDKNTVNRPVDGPKFCEQWIDEMMDEMDGPHDYFILPGGNLVSAQCHVIRARMRTAERRLISLHKVDPVEEFILKYINRLSDLFFALSRYELFKAGYTEEKLRPFIMRFDKK
ncbi:MAG: cob(I)yrinic acid a,c-diamide adenosyltransferase [Prolixibacteraceae bacterium]|jgi:cob(I)alamin adenosyltransferase|nr:cob(I)yrinic acid a,c-diamide adenosyltransferase [Prolixibacteraceae bacterium]